MKKTLMIMAITAATVFVASASAWAWGGNATGEITSVRNNGSAIATVEGSTQGGKLWLGFSYKCGNGGWQDRSPTKVKGNFSETFTMGMCPQGYSAIRSCLWEGKNGSSMEGRVDCYDK